MVVVFHEQLSKQEKAEFTSFIATKSPQIKIDKYDVIKILNWMINGIVTFAVVLSLIFLFHRD